MGRTDRTRLKRFRPRVEHLEDRTLPSTASSIIALSGVTLPRPVEGQPVASTVLLRFRDSVAQAQANSFVATVQPGDGATLTSVANALQVQVVADPKGGFDLRFGNYTYAEAAANRTFTVNLGDAEGAVLARRGVLRVADAPLSAGALTPPPSLGVGQPLHNDVVFHFTDGNPSSSAADFTATVATGDGHSLLSVTNPTAVQVVANPRGGFDVQLSTTYSRPLTGAVFAVRVSDRDGAATGASSAHFAVDAALTAGALSPPVISEGPAVVRGLVFHFTDADPSARASLYTATVQTGDGAVLSSQANPQQVQVVANRHGGFDVLLNYIYTHAVSGGTFAVQIADPGGSTTSATRTGFVVTDLPLTAGALTPPAPVEGQPFGPAVVFHFTDANPTSSAGNYSATVQPGDGATLTSAANPPNVQVVAAAAGGFNVLLSYQYANFLTAGTFAVRVVDSGGARAGAARTAFAVADAPLTAGAVTPPTTYADVPLGTATILHFTDADPNAQAGAFTAVVQTGDGTTLTTADPQTVQVVPDPNGGFDVRLSYAYRAPGTDTLAVRVTDAGSSTASASGTVVVQAPLAAASAGVVAGAGSPFQGEVATFTDRVSAASAADFLATIAWGDGQTSTGRIAYDAVRHVFAVTGSNTYAGMGSYVLQVAIADDLGNTASATSTVVTVPVVALTGVADPLALGASGSFALAVNDNPTGLDVQLAVEPSSTLTGYTLGGTGVSVNGGNLTVHLNAGQLAAAVVVTTANPSGMAEAADTLTLDVVPAVGYVVSSAQASASATGVANGLVVTNTNAAGNGSLAQAVANADADTSGQPRAISFATSPGQTFATPQSIALAGTLALTNTTPGAALTLQGPAAGLTLAGGGPGSNFSVLRVAAGVTANVDRLTIANGSVQGGYAPAGGIANAGILTVSNATLSGNVTGYGGGAIGNIGTLTVQNVTFSNNAAAYGGGIYNAYGNVTVGDSTFLNNTAAEGGAIYNYFTKSDGTGTLTVAGSTFTGNSATWGGGAILDVGTAAVRNSVLTGNASTNGGGGGIGLVYGGNLALANTELSNDAAGGNLSADSSTGSAYSGTNLAIDGNSFAQLVTVIDATGAATTYLIDGTGKAFAYDLAHNSVAATGTPSATAADGSLWFLGTSAGDQDGQGNAAVYEFAAGQLYHLPFAAAQLSGTGAGITVVTAAGQATTITPLHGNADVVEQGSNLAILTGASLQTAPASAASWVACTYQGQPSVAVLDTAGQLWAWTGASWTSLANGVTQLVGSQTLSARRSFVAVQSGNVLDGWDGSTLQTLGGSTAIPVVSWVATDYQGQPSVAGLQNAGGALWAWTGASWTELTSSADRITGTQTYRSGVSFVMLQDGEYLSGWDGAALQTLGGTSPTRVMSWVALEYRGQPSVAALAPVLGGVWAWTGAGWTQLTASADQLVGTQTYRDGLSFVMQQDGQYLSGWDGSTVQRLGGSTATPVVSWVALEDQGQPSVAGLTVAGGAVWAWNGTGWAELTASADRLVGTQTYRAGLSFVMQQDGTYLSGWDGSTVQRLGGSTATPVVSWVALEYLGQVSAAGLTVAGGALWAWTGAAWTELTSSTDSIVGSQSYQDGATFVMAQDGRYLSGWDGSTFQGLFGESTTAVVTWVPLSYRGQASVAAVAPDNTIWAWTGTTWTELAAGGDQLVGPAQYDPTAAVALRLGNSELLLWNGTAFADVPNLQVTTELSSNQVLYLLQDGTLYTLTGGGQPKLGGGQVSGMAQDTANEILLLDHDGTLYTASLGQQPNPIAYGVLKLVQFGADQALYMTTKGYLYSVANGGAPVLQGVGYRLPGLEQFGTNQVVFLTGDGSLDQYAPGQTTTVIAAGVQSMVQFGTGEILFTDTAGLLYSLVPGGRPAYQNVHGVVSLVQLGNSEAMYQLNTNSLYTWSVGGQPSYAGTAQALVHVGTSEVVYVLADGNVYDSVNGRTPWHAGQDAVTAPDGTIWFLSATNDDSGQGDHSILYLSSAGIRGVSSGVRNGSASLVYASGIGVADGKLWVTDNAQEVFWFDGSRWQQQHTVIGPDHGLWFLGNTPHPDRNGNNNYAILRFLGNQLSTMPGLAVALAAQESTLWVENAASAVCWWNGTTFPQQPAVIMPDSVWFLGNQGNIDGHGNRALYRFIYGAVEVMPGTALKLGTAEGAIWVANSDGVVCTWDPHTNTFPVQLCAEENTGSVWFRGTTADIIAEFVLYEFDPQGRLVPTWRMNAAIADAWLSNGGPTSAVGVPISDETDAGTQRVVHFTNGDIFWNPTTGMISVTNTAQTNFLTNTDDGVFRKDARYTRRPTLVVITPGACSFYLGGANAGRSLSQGDTKVTQSFFPWEAQLADAYQTALELAGSQTFVMTINWDSLAPNTSAAKQVAQHIQNWLGGRVNQDINVVLIGHSRGAIFNNVVALELGQPANMGSLMSVMLDPTASTTMGDHWPFDRAACVTREVDYDDQQPFAPFGVTSSLGLTIDGRVVTADAYIPIQALHATDFNASLSHMQVPDAYLHSTSLDDDIHWLLDHNPSLPLGNGFAPQTYPKKEQFFEPGQREVVLVAAPIGSENTLHMGWNNDQAGNMVGYISLLGVGGTSLSIGKNGIQMQGSLSFVGSFNFGVAPGGKATFGVDAGPVTTSIDISGSDVRVTGSIFGIGTIDVSTTDGGSVSFGNRRILRW